MYLNAFIPLGLLFLGLKTTGARAAPALKPAAAKPAAAKPAAKKPAAKKPAAPTSARPSSAPKTESDGAAQAAVNAAVSDAIRQEIARNAGQPLPAAVVSTPAPAEVVRSPRQAALDLATFLRQTGRFGTLKDRPEQTKSAQRDLGVTDDGIVGPRTRAAAQKVGITLPPIKHPAKK